MRSFTVTDESNEEKLKGSLESGLKALGLVLSDESQAKLVRFVRLLDKWNHVYNLTAVRDPAQMITRHILDSLAVLPYIKGPRVVDVGTGAGLPGIPLALARPDLRVVLLDSNAKRTLFLTQALAELGMTNAEVVRERAERYHPDARFDTVVSRAFASLGEMLQSAGHLAAEGGQFVAMKGVYPQEELSGVPSGYDVRSVDALRVPGLEAARHVVVIAR